MAGFIERTFSPGQPGGLSRIAALGFFVLAVFGAGVALIEPQFAHWAGAVLLGAIGFCSVVLFFAALPRRTEGAEEVRRAASAAASSNVAWAVTARDGAVLDCNTAYRFLAGAGEGEPPAPPQLAFPGEGPAAALYRLSRAAVDGRAREENFETESGQRLTASVRALKRGESAWWFVPRLPEASPPKGAASEKRIPSALIRFTDFFRNAPVGVAITGADGKVAEANGAFAEFFALGAFAAGARFADLVSPAERDAALERITRAAQGNLVHEPVEIHPAAGREAPDYPIGGNAAPGGTAAHFENGAQSAPGGTAAHFENGAQGALVDRSAQLFASPFMATPDGDPQAILYLVDTSEQKALEIQFAQSQKMQAIGQLAGGIAHDFNNLLQAIIGNCDLLLMRHTAGDPSFADINEVRQNSVRAAGLVRQLLAFSRQQTMQPKVLALNDTLSELSLLLRRLLGERVTLSFENAQDLWPVRADEGQISNVIMNLAVNARDAMPPEGGTVTIRTSNFSLTAARSVGTATMPPGDYVLIEVIDTGAGIAKENLSKIFEPFYTTKAVGQGTGLGLSTAYGVVKQTGGFIIVDSELGKGTSFNIYLPRYVPAEGAAPEPEEVEIAAPRDVTGQDTILLVEDEEAVRRFAARALRMRGYTVIEAGGGEAALDIVRQHQGVIDLLITDVVMPSMDGPALVRAVRRLRPEMCIIYMSGYAQDAFKRGGEKAEELHFLPKPFGLKQLVAKVKEVLSGAPPAKISEALGEEEG